MIEKEDLKKIIRQVLDENKRSKVGNPYFHSGLTKTQIINRTFTKLIEVYALKEPHLAIENVIHELVVDGAVVKGLKQSTLTLYRISDSRVV